jgi:hypothetical protein
LIALSDCGALKSCVLEKGSDRRETSIAGASTISSLMFEVIKEVYDEVRVQ